VGFVGVLLGQEESEEVLDGPEVSEKLESNYYSQIFPSKHSLHFCNCLNFVCSCFQSSYVENDVWDPVII
jgi:hypothetical protein